MNISFFFSKSANYKSNKDQVRVYDTAQLKKWWVKYPERYNPKGKALDEVWEFPIPTQGSWGDKYIRHFCPLPQDMVATMIQISTEENDTILDPFAGTGTVLSQSAYMNRSYIGFELNPEYIQMFNDYLNKTLEQQRKEFEVQKNRQDQTSFEDRILKLRSLKFARVLVTKIDRLRKDKNYKIYVKEKGFSSLKHKIIRVEYQFIGNILSEEISEELKMLINKPPLSKFGIEPVFKFRNSKKMIKTDYCYTKTNTYSFIKNVDPNSSKVRVFSKIGVDLNENDYS